MKIDIVVVNWNSGRQLEDCIASIREYHGGFVGRCTVVDNGSTDGSTKFLAKATDVDLVLAKQNLGFGRACNLGVSRGQSPYVLLLNPDARLMESSLAVPAAWLQNRVNVDVGIIGVQLVNEHNLVQRSCARFPSAWQMMSKSLGLSAFIKKFDFHMHDWDHSETRLVDHVMGAFFLIERDLYKKLNGMDERFFVYLEDLDLSKMAAQAGFLTLYLSEAQAFHRGGGVSEQVKAHRLFYSLRSRLQYSCKHFSYVGAAGVAGTTLLIEPLSRLFFLAFLRRWTEIGDLGLAYYMLWGWVLGRLRDGAD